MQTRATRFYLRIESGERLGEEVPLPEGATQFGRRADNAVILKDGSVSGQHAEIRVNGGDVQLLDLGSTNGTKIGGRKVERASLAHGDVVFLGSVKLAFFDAQMASAAPAPSPSAPEAGALERISAEKVSRSGARSKRGLAALLVLVLLAGAVVTWRLVGRREAGARALVLPEVPGNLLDDASFEQGTPEWTSAESAPQGFVRDRSSARSGALGLGIALGEGEWSLARSGELELRARRRVEFAGELRVEEEDRKSVV